MGALGTILIFGSIIVFHEFGHFIIAKLTGMTVHEFSVGFGPAIFKRQIGETLYALRALPLGGFVRIAGMDPGETDHPNGFDKKPFLARFGAIVAGSTMNFVLALIVFIVMGLTVGFSTDRALIGGISKNSPASEAGIKPGDLVLKIADTDYPRYSDIPDLIKNSKAPIPITLERNGTPYVVKVTPRALADSKTPIVGISPLPVLERASFVASITRGFDQVYTYTRDTFFGFIMLISGKASLNDIMGPVGIISTTNAVGSQALQSAQAMQRFLFVFALISISIGFFNLLPIPALDGSHLLILCIEKIRGRQFNKEKTAIVHIVGMLILLSLIAVISVREIMMLASKVPK